jgi:hypothetical protein
MLYQRCKHNSWKCKSVVSRMLSLAHIPTFAAAAASDELRFGSCDATLGFLPEHLIPKDFKRHIEEVSRCARAVLCKCSPSSWAVACLECGHNLRHHLVCSANDAVAVVSWAVEISEVPHRAGSAVTGGAAARIFLPGQCGLCTCAVTCFARISVS